MAEPVRARRLTDQEGRRLQQIVRRGKHGSVRVRRAMIIMASASGTPVPAIARLVAADEDTVRDVVHLFNAKGLAALDPQWAGGRPRLISDDDIAIIAGAATTRPEKLGLPFTCWSLRKLAAYLAGAARPVAIGRERLRQILHAQGISFQRTRTWKESTDPGRGAKLDRIGHVTSHYPDRCFAFDQFGPSPGGHKARRVRTISPGRLAANHVERGRTYRQGGPVMAASVSPPGSGEDMYAEPLAAPPARLRPGRAWYLVALAVIVTGVAWLLVGLGALNGQINSFQRVALPGNGEITLAHGGAYVIYYEGPGAAAGKAPALTVRLRPLSASAAVQGITPSGSISFSFGSHADTAVLNLKIAHPGRFLLQARAPAAPAGSRVAVGSSVGGSLARIIVPFIALIVVGVCGVVAVAFIRGSRGSRGRRQALARFAPQYGMQYSEDDPYGLPGHDFGLLREGNRRGCQNVLSGRWEDLPVKEADYWYGTGNSFSDKGYRRDFSIVIAELAATMPNISVVPYALLGEKQRGTGHRGRRDSHGIRFGSEDFDRKFKVTASDKEFAARLIDPAMIQWLLSTGGQFGFVIQGSELLVSCDQLPATGLVPLFDTAKGFTDHIPQLVWADYKTS